MRVVGDVIGWFAKPILYRARIGFKLVLRKESTESHCKLCFEVFITGMHTEIEQGWAVISGQSMPLKDAKISITDPGFLRGWSVFDTLCITNDAPWRSVEKHLLRLAQSAKAAMIPMSMSDNS